MDIKPEATIRVQQITHPELLHHKTRAPTAPERTISGNRAIHPVIVRGLINQQGAADDFLQDLDDLCTELLSEE